MNKKIYQTAGKKKEKKVVDKDAQQGEVIPEDQVWEDGKIVKIVKTGTKTQRVIIGVYYIDAKGNKIKGLKPVPGTVPRKKPKKSGGIRQYQNGGPKMYQQAGINEDTRPIATRNINTDFFDPNFSLNANVAGNVGGRINFNPRLSMGPDSNFYSPNLFGTGQDRATFGLSATHSNSMAFKNDGKTFLGQPRNTLGVRGSYQTPIGNRGIMFGGSGEFGGSSGQNIVDDQTTSPYLGTQTTSLDDLRQTGYGQVGAGLGYYPKHKNWGIKGNINYGTEGSNAPGVTYGAQATFGPATFNIDKNRQGWGGGFGLSLPIGGPTRRQNQTGGMYGSNTMSAAGQGMAPQLGMSSTIVGQETDPALQQARMQGLAQSGQGLSEQSQVLSQQTRQQEVIDKQRAEQEAMQAEQQYQQQNDAIGSAVGRGAQLLGNQVSQGKAPGPGGWGEAWNTGKTAYNLTKAANMAQDVSKMNEAAQLVTDAGGWIGSSADAAQTGTMILDASGDVVNAGSALGSAAGSAMSARPWGTIANYAGKGIKKLSDDDDPTHSNVGEYAGNIVSRAGQGLAAGSFFPGPGNLIGAGIGAVVGAVEQGVGTAKAGRAQQEYESEARIARNEGIYDLNERIGGLYGSHMSNVAAGNLAQKTVSGQNLGRNVMYKNGGMMMRMPRYGYNS